MTIPETADCVAPSCIDEAVPGLLYCRRHAPIEELRARRLAEEDDAGLDALERMDAGEPQSVSVTPSDYRMIDRDGHWGCKVDGCPGRSRRTRGPLAYLCDEHADAKQELMTAATHERLGHEPDATPPAPTEPDHVPPALPAIVPPVALEQEFFQGGNPDDLAAWAETLREKAERQREIAGALDTIADGAGRLAELL